MIKEFQGEYAFLSNFFPCQIEMDGEVYPSVEHAFQAAKTFDLFARSTVCSCSTAGKARRMGKTLVLREDWEQVKLEIMFRLVLEKFSKNPDLRRRLFLTGEQELVEGNTWGDTFWGVCQEEGKNHLGIILMRVRALLREALR